MAGVEPISASIGAAIGGVQAIVGAIGAERANKDLKKLFSQRKAFQTPAEVFEQLQLRQFDSQQGYSDQTMNYLTGQAGAGLSAGLGVAKTLGADPNQISGILDSYYSDIFKVGAESDLVKMKKFDSLTSALNLVADNKTAEWQSKENLIKDQMQAAAQRLAAGQQNVQSGLNFGVQGLTNLASGALYNPDGTLKAPKSKITVGGGGEENTWYSPTRQGV